MNVLDLIKKYPRIFPPLENGKISNSYTSVPEGWIPVLDHMLGAIQHHVDTYIHLTDTESKPCEQVVCSLMREVFGDLKFYYTGGNAYVAGMVQLTSYICEHICCVCGTGENLGITMEHLSTCCKDCFDDGKVPGETWKSTEEINNQTYVR